MTEPTATVTILLVEDEPPIRRLIRRVLEGEGYEMLEAGNGDEALALAAGHSGQIDLLLTDAVMPRMDGFMLQERLNTSRPDTRVLFLSGYADQSVTVRGGLREAGQAFLLKPFTRHTLLQSVHSQLAPAEPAAPTGWPA
jgi:two-component system cell cycle sensor histidine kinase/response regulator CckA